ncbi:MAG TPA: chemotaxis protein CheB [Stellaceae bacterium]|nr:chemotaxis protein CheB [Stellaceae bacterium]
MVGIGASAGGLDAVRNLFDALPAGSGMAFILVQHLDPTHESLMVGLLAGHTPMKVQQAADGMRLEREHVYVIPPGSSLAVGDGALQLSKPRERHGARMPFDFLLRSMAQELGERAICIVLSGTGADGSAGLKAIKEKGGLVLAQHPDEAGFDGMPRSAIMTGAVDLVLPVAKMPGALAKYVRRKFGAGAPKGAPPRDPATERLNEIIDLLRTRAAHDFTLYKPGTLQRRIERRMALAATNDAAQYLNLLRKDAGELDRLAKDLLINVTGFFRDPKIFELLAAKVVADLVRLQPADRPLWIWVAGCSTGEETYTIAMLFLEAIEAAKRPIKLQVFASDIDADAVAFARDGVYPDSIAADVSPARLARFFAKEEHGYRVAPDLRGLVVFTVQNVLADPPFSRLDLVSCRNLLIYLRPEAQAKVLSLFHFALREGGILLLGSSETVGTLEDRFEPIFKAERIYRHIGRSRPRDIKFPLAGREGARAFRLPGLEPAEPHRPGLGDIAQRSLLEAYAPASVLISRKNECLYYLGATDRYLRVASGEPSRDLLGMAREGLRNKLRAAIQQASEEHKRAVVSGAQMKMNGGFVAVSVAVQPVQSEGEDMLLVSFLDEPKSEPRPARSAASPGPVDASRIEELEHELEITRKELQSAVRDLELSNEEQKAINEEALSVNEEFLSTNEELTTSKEELQSLNEELTALNSQLQETLEQQRSTSNDLQNILYSADAATLFLDLDLKIRFFTPAAQSLFRIIARDIGRPLADLTSLSADRDLLADARNVLTSHAPLKREIEAQDGAWYNRRILPYRTDDGQVEGVVVTFADISDIKAAERETEAARAYSDSIIDTIRQPFVVLDAELRVVSANRSFFETFALKPEETVGQPLGDAAARHADSPGLRDFLDWAQAEPDRIEDCGIELELPLLGKRSLRLNARKIRDGAHSKGNILLAIDDVTERNRAAELVEAAKLQAEQANLGKSRFLAAASHDLRQPLQTISLLQGLLASKVKDEGALKLVARLDETLTAMSGMLNTLLDINQLEAGIVRAETVSFPVTDLIERLRAEFSYHAASQRLGWRVVSSRLAVHSDPRLLEQMLRNLLANAMKYTLRGKVLLGCRRRGDKLRIEIWDTGPGIPEGQLRRIFEEFHQLDNPARERTRGLGLGLAIVQRLADLLGHRIDVRSHPGKGSVFAVEVPLAQIEPAEQLSGRHTGVEEGVRRSGTILVVEDEPVVREMLELLLDGEGHRTVTASDGKQALELVARRTMQPDLVVADYSLPNDLNGLQVIAGVQKILRHEIPAIILTGDISTDAIRLIARQGCTHLSKPVKTKELTHLIQQLLAKPKPAPPPSARPQPQAAGGAQPETIIVVDDDNSLRETMRELLEAEGKRVESYASGEAFFAAHHAGGGDCLLVDAGMPGMSGLDVLERLKTEGHHLPAIMITGDGDVRMAVRAMNAGAADFIEKPIGRDELLASIERALEQTRDSAKLSAWRETAAARISGLTTRQKQIMDLVLAGQPSKNIAADLGISQRTIENHRAAIMKKTGSKSLPALIRLALAAT